MKVFIVLPIYNEAKRISKVLEGISKFKLPVVLVDDGSDDSTKLKLKGSKTQKLAVLTHKVNLGKGAALKTGCDYAFSKGADYVITMDSDGQHRSSDLGRFLDTIKSKKYDVILGSRNMGMGAPLDRFLGNKIASVLVGLMFGIYVSDLLCGFRALSKSAYKKIRWDSLGYGVEVEMIIRLNKAKLTHCEVPVETVYYDNYKGVSILDGMAIFGNLFYWKLTL